MHNIIMFLELIQALEDDDVFHGMNIYENYYHFLAKIQYLILRQLVTWTERFVITGLYRIGKARTMLTEEREGFCNRF